MKSVALTISRWCISAVFFVALVYGTSTSARLFVSASQFLPYDLYPTIVAINLVNNDKIHSIYHPQAYVRPAEYNPEWRNAADKIQVQQTNISYVYHPLYVSALSLLFKGEAPTAIADAFWWASITALVVLVLQVMKMAHVTARSVAPVTLAIACSLISTADALSLGQNTLIAAAVGLTALRFLIEPGRRRTVGVILFIIACTMKPWFVLCIFALLILRRFRLAIITLLAYGAVVEVLPWLLLPPEVVGQFWIVRMNLAKLHLAAINDYSASAVIFRYLLDDPRPFLGYWDRELHTPANLELWQGVTNCVVATVIAIGGIRYRGGENLAIGLGLATPLLVLGVAWTHYFIFLFPLLSLLIFDFQSSPFLGSMSILTAVRLQLFRLSNQVTGNYQLWYLALPYLFTMVIITSALFRSRQHPMRSSLEPVV